AGRRAAALRGQERAPALRERLDHEGGGELPVAPDARVRRAHQLRERPRALADLEHAVDEQEGRRVRHAGIRVDGLSHTASRRSARQRPPRASPSTAATRTRPGRAPPATTSRPARAGGTSPRVGGTTPVETASAAAPPATAPAPPKTPPPPPPERLEDEDRRALARARAVGRRVERTRRRARQQAALAQHLVEHGAELVGTAGEADVDRALSHLPGAPGDRRLARGLLGRQHRGRSGDAELDRGVAERGVEDQVREEERVALPAREEPIEEGCRLLEVPPCRAEA